MTVPFGQCREVIPHVASGRGICSRVSTESAKSARKCHTAEHRAKTAGFLGERLALAGRYGQRTQRANAGLPPQQTQSRHVLASGHPFREERCVVQIRSRQSLIELATERNTFVSLEELAAPFSKHIVEHLRI